MLAQAHSILKNTFGYSTFRPLQEEVISRALEKKNSLVIMPTGGGKSLCYQIPALVFNGITIVVSPLISLMKDQVEQLLENGISAVYLNSSLTRKQYDIALLKIRSGATKLVYVAPETLLQDRIIQLLLADVTVDCITIDEAHCISEWGHDFRPEYRQIASFRKRFPEAVCIALTATATPEVRTDIVASLELSQAEVFIDSFDRPNLFLQVAHKSQAVKQVLDFIKPRKNIAGIIYCFSRKQVDDLTLQLNKSGYSARAYHAGLSDKERDKNQTDFIKDDVSIMVATIAFGMGINKPDVRYVIHFDLPKNIESYYQQIGRAGRDGLPSECLLLYNFADTHKINFFIEQKFGQEREIAERQLAQLLRYIESTECRRISLLQYFGETYKNLECTQCDVCVQNEVETQDFTVQAQKFISCMIRTGEMFGANYLIDVLRGSRNQKILQNRHDSLSTFGIGMEWKKEQWGELSRLLLKKKLIRKEEQFGSLKVLESAKSILQNKAKFLGFMDESIQENTSSSSVKSTRSKANETLKYERALFDELKAYRKKLADAKGIPPFAVFHDNTLIQMATVFPITKDALKQITGIGEKKAESYGTEFAKIIVAYCLKNGIKLQKSVSDLSSSKSKIKKTKTNLPKSKKSGKAEQVCEMFNKGTRISELAEVFQVKNQTILNYLKTCVDEGLKVNENYLLKESILSVNLQNIVVDAIKNEETDLLKPVFEKLNGTISYDELRIMQLYVKNAK